MRVLINALAALLLKKSIQIFCYTSVKLFTNSKLIFLALSRALLMQQILGSRYENADTILLKNSVYCTYVQYSLITNLQNT